MSGGVRDSSPCYFETLSYFDPHPPLRRFLARFPPVMTRPVCTAGPKSELWLGFFIGDLLSALAVSCWAVSLASCCDGFCA